MLFQISIFIIFIFENLNKKEDICSLRFRACLKRTFIDKVGVFFVYGLYEGIVIRVSR